MAAKRPAGEEGPVPPAKRPTVPLTPLHVPPATSQEDLDIKILQVKINSGWIKGVGTQCIIVLAQLSYIFLH